MFSLTKSAVALALTTLPALGATVTIEKLWIRTAAGGDPVPGRPSPVVFREITGTDASSRPLMLPPVINNVGQVVFRARSASQFDNNALNAFGIYAKRPGFPLAVLVDTTSTGGVATFPVPGRPVGTVFSNFKAPLINDAGDVVFFARFTGAPGSGSGFYATHVTGGPIVKLADTFTTVPGHPTATFRQFDFTVSQLLTASLNNDGDVAYWGEFLIPPAVFPNVTNALFGTSVLGGAGVLLVDSTQTPTITPPLGPPGGFRELRPTPVINSAGTVIFSGNLGPTPSFRNGVFSVPVGGGAIGTVAFIGQPVPGRALQFTQSFDPAGHSFDMNDSGVVIFRNAFPAGGGEAGHYAATPSGPSYVHTRIIDTLGCTSGPCLPIPGESVPPSEYSGSSPPPLNESGQVGVYSFVINTPVPNQQGYFATDTDGSPISVVANLSTPPPGLPAPVGGFPRFGNFFQESAIINDEGHMSFVGFGNLTPSTGFYGLYFYDACTPELSRISDTTISLSQLGHAITTPPRTPYDIWQVESKSGHLKSIGNNNDVVFSVVFNNLDSGMFIAHVDVGGGGQLAIACPANVTAECPADTNSSATGTATASGCGEITVTFTDSATPGCGGTENITRTWTADNGSTTASCQQTITEADTTGPVLSGVPDKASAECGSVPPPANVTANDACKGSVAVSLSETSSEGPCPGTYTLTRTWTATDGCGNMSEASHSVCVIDSTDPTLMGIPGDTPAECDAVPPAATPTSSDSCDTMPAITFSESRADGTCPDEYALTRTWTATDDCGNDVSQSQTVTVDDTTAPSITCPAHTTSECPADTSVAANGSATGEDNCGTTTISSGDAATAGCGTTRTITRTWTAADECGNSSSCDQLVAVVDTIPPTLTVDTTPITVTDEDCSGTETVSLPVGTANDACDGPRPVTNDAPSSFSAGPTTVTYSTSDDCGNTVAAQVSVMVLAGANIHVIAQRHQVGSGSHPGSTKTPLAGIEVCAYDKAQGSCARELCSGISHREYQCIWDNCTPANCCTTDSTGECMIGVLPGNYIVVSGDATKTTLPDPLGVSVGDVHCGQIHRKHLQQIVRADGSKKPGKTTRLTGSELLIIEPEFIVWDNTEQLYPFIFETVGDWTVTATVAPPEGFIADHEQLTAEVDNELESVQFTITEVGSDLVPTQTTFSVLHNGKRRVVRSDVAIRLTPDYARSRGFNVEELKTRGLIAEPARMNRPMKPAGRPTGR